MTAPPRDEERIFQEVERLLSRRSELNNLLGDLEKELDSEHRSEEKNRKKQRIAERESELSDVEKLLTSTIPNDYPQLQKRVWINHAHKYKQNGDYQRALDKWEQIASAYPEDAQVIDSVAAIKELIAWRKQKNTLIAQLSSHFDDLGPLYTQIIKHLKKTEDPESDALVGVIRNFVDVNQPMGIEAFTETWNALADLESEQSDKFAPEYYKRLARRINNGEMVVVLGSGVPLAYDTKAPDEASFANKLAKDGELTEHQHRLPTVAEFYECRTDLGRSTLLKGLNREMPANAMATNIDLYQTLAKSNRPLILISCAYDNLLEQAFQQQGKRYVEILSIVASGYGEPVGNVLLQYSDRTKDQNSPISYSKDDISQLNLIGQGYSLIYKIRGCCNGPMTDDKADSARQAALTLLESDYFNFARFAERIIPGLVSSEFRTRDFMFIGLHPKHWEERLMVKAILDQCNSEHRKRMLVSCSDGDLEKAYWHSRSVQDQHINIQELNGYLESTGSTP